MTSASPPRGNRALWAAGAAVVAFGIAAAGEYLLRGDAPMWQPLLCYLAAALILAATAARFAPAPAQPPDPANEAVLWRLLSAGALLALCAAAVTFVTLLDNLRSPWGPWLWLATVAILVATGLAARRFESPANRWRGTLPASRKRRIAFLVALLVLIAAGITARIIWLDRIPLGINPDEGDRTATAMQVIRGTTPQQLFEAGWYRISMMYFYLLAAWLKVAGIGYVQARTFTALWGVVTLCTVAWIGVRNWNWRVTLFAAAAFGMTGVALQFSRETSEAGPTTALWAISVALLLEGARRGRALAWICAGLAGGYSLYFYPSGRTWPLLAVCIGVVWLIQSGAARDGAWPRLLRGLVLAAIASIAVASPFFAQTALFPREFALRFAETSVLKPENALRLAYVDPSWSVPRLLGEQVARALGIFARYGDGAGFWPTDRPLVGPVLALLILLGLGYGLLRWRDPRAVAVALWALVGMAGMVLTVETPNLQRMATALPALLLGAAVLLDDVVVRLVNVARAPRRRALLEWLAAPAAALLLLGALAFDARFYFNDYAQMNRWEGWNQEGYALTLLPPDTLHVSVGNSFHMVNSGWVRLLAPNAQRGGVRAPGSMLPLPEDGARGLAFLLYPDQAAYLPWLLDLYPTAAPIDYRRSGEGHYFDFLYVDPAAVTSSRGAMINVGGDATGVATLGAAPPFATLPGAQATWSATLRVPQQYNYAFRLEGAPARLYLDGVPILTRSADDDNTFTILNLARGDHGLVLDGSAEGAHLAWARVGPGAEPQFSPLGLADLARSDGAPHGFSGQIEIDGAPPQIRQDNSLATCCLGGLLDSRNRRLRAVWSARLATESAGDYHFQLTLPGPGTLRIGDEVVIRIDAAEGGVAEGALPLPAGEQPIAVELQSESGANGALELIWTPPGGPRTILPASVLRPAAPIFGPPLADEILRTPDAWPVDKVLETVE